MKNYVVQYRNGYKNTIEADGIDVRSGMVVFLMEEFEPLGLKCLEAFLAINTSDVSFVCSEEKYVEVHQKRNEDIKN